MPTGAPHEPKDHVLLIGIDAYDGCRSLRGCVNDIDAIQRILIERVGIRPERITRLASPRFETTHPTDVPEELPTLAAIRAALKRLGSEAVGPADRVLIYYSGHGTRVRVQEPRGTPYFREALVPKDHVVAGEDRRFLFDWELNELLAAIARRTTAVTFVLDACCSWGLTREEAVETSESRFVESPDTQRFDAPLPVAAAGRGLVSAVASTVQACVVVAACLEDERARESNDAHGVCHGELTRALVSELGTISDDLLGALRWGRIWPQLKTRVNVANPAQNPWISGGHARRVFGSPPEDGDVGYGVTRQGDEYRLGVGSLFAITKGAELAVYGSEPFVLPPLGSAADKALRPPRIRVIDAERESARANAVDAPFDLPPGARARLVEAGEAARLRVSVSPPHAELERLLRESALLELVGESEPSELQIMQGSDGSWSLLDDVFGFGDSAEAPFLVRVAAQELPAMRELAEHYYWYSLPVRVAKLCQDLPHSLHLTLHDAREAASVSEAEARDPSRFPELLRDRDACYVLAAGETGTSSSAPVCIGVRNISSTPLLVTLVACNNSGRVEVLSEQLVTGGSAQLFWAGDTLKKPFRATRPKGHATSIDRILAIGTTNRRASLQHFDLRTSFEALLTRWRDMSSSRDVDGDEDSPPLEQWTSDVITLRVVTPTP